MRKRVKEAIGFTVTASVVVPLMTAAILVCWVSANRGEDWSTYSP